LKASLRLYVYAINFIGVLLVAYCLFQVTPEAWFDKILFLGLAGAVQLMPIILARQSYISVSWSVTYAAILLFGPLHGALAGATVGLVGSFYPKRLKLHKLVFNVSTNAIAAFMAGIALTATNDLAWAWVFQLLVIPLLHYALLTFLVTLAISLATGLSPRGIWSENYRSLTLHNLLLATFGLGLYKAYELMGLQGLIIFILPLLMARYSFQLYIKQTKKVQEQVESLESSNVLLNRKVNELAALQQHSLMMGASLNLESTLASVFARVEGDVPYRPVEIVWKLEETRLSPYEKVWRSEAGKILFEPVAELSNELQQVFNEGKRLVRIGADEGPARLICPMITLGDVKGVMTLLCPQDLLEEVDSSLEVYVSHATAALSNANLFQYVEKIANTDNLTKLYNRHYFARIVRDLSGMQRAPVTVVIMDFDNFKDINNRYGHHVGDMALHYVASLIKRESREEDIPVRFGGDEFALLLPGATEETGLIVATKLQEQMRSAVELDGMSLHIGLSIGIATCLPDHEDVQETVKKADRAAYFSKARGKGCITLHSQIPLDQQPHYEEEPAVVPETNESEAKRSITKGLLQALKARDVLTYNHSLSVAMHAVRLAAHIGLGAEELERIKIGALLHDIGKLGISDLLLYKQALLNEKEVLSMRTHPVIGRDLLEHFGDLFRTEMPIILSHHEHYDGGGYPHGLRASHLELCVRIVSIADAFDAMTRDQLYREGMPVGGAVRELQRCAGTQFDPNLVDRFVESLKQYVPEQQWEGAVGAPLLIGSCTNGS